MASDTVVAANILCEARNRQKFREIGQNLSQDNSMMHLQQQLCGNSNQTPARHQLGLSNTSLGPTRHLNEQQLNSRLSPSLNYIANPSRNPVTTGERPSTKETGNLKAKFAESSNAKDWSFSTVTRKLYAARNKRINVCFWDKLNHLHLLPDKENVQDSSQYFVRLLLVYGSDQHITRPVVRCQPHLEGGKRLSGSPNQVIDLSPASRFPIGEEEEHVVRCHNSGTRHIRDQVSGRYSVIIPVHLVPAIAVKSEPQNLDIDGSEPTSSIDIDISFGCLNTCLGAEYSLRSWNVVVTLENRDLSVLGRCLIPVKICAAPKRERSVEEENAVKGKQKRLRTSNNFEDEQKHLATLESPKVMPPSPSALNGDSQPHPTSSKCENLFISVESLEELALLTNLRDELRSSPMLRSLLQAKLDSKIV